MAVEKYLALASVGLLIMFCGEMIVFYNYLISPKIEVEPEPQILMYVSIGAAPALSLVGTVFIMERRYGSRSAGAIIIAGGAVLLAGMLYASTIVPQIDKNYLIYAVETAPKVFMGVAVAVMATGALLFRTRVRPKRVF
ncbi:MAG TPA: hypothetical protein VFM64_00120 [Candidatus Nitrosotenuis sp.]|nr:hypothetical protein [Candidatus Nitrosotenuis sp.]